MGKFKVLSAEELREETQHFFHALNEVDDFSMVLMTTSFLDEALKSLLNCNLVPEYAKDMLTGPFGGLARRRDACTALGLITPVMRENIKRIGDIRNPFAHSHKVRSLDDPEVAKLCRKLKLPQAKVAFRVGYEQDEVESDSPWPYGDDPREKFRLVVMMLCTRLHLSVLSSTPPEECRVGWEKHDESAS